MTRRRLVAAAAALAVLTAGGAACAPSKQEAQQGGSGDGTFTVATTTDVVNFNPLLGSSRTDSWVTGLMYPRMMDIDAQGRKRPSLATKWGYDGDRTVYWEIKRGLKWSDGKPLTAADVAFTINAVQKDKPAGVVTGLVANVASAEAVSATRVEAHLARPDSTVAEEVGFWMNVVPKHVFGAAPSVAKFANASSWVSAGPYRLTKVVKGQSYTLDRVTPYPLTPGGTPSMKRIVFRVYPDVNSEILALKKGDVDLIANALPPSQVKNLRGTSGIKVQEVPGLGYAHMTYNMQRKPLTNTKVRQALAHAVDYAAIRRVVLQNQGVTTGSCPIPPVLKAYADPACQEYAHDPKLAVRLLQQAGYHKDGSGKFPITLTMIYSSQDPATAQWASIVKSGAAEVGVTIKLRGLDRNAYIAKSDSGDYDIYAGNFAIMDDPPTNMTLTYLPGGAINYSRVDEPALTKVVKAAQVARSDQEQRTLVRQASDLVRTNVYDNVMYTQNLYVAYGSGWKGFTVQPSELLSVVNPASLAAVRQGG